MTNLSSAILLTNQDYSYASSLKRILKDNNYELVYASKLEKLIDLAIINGQSLVFIDNCFSRYKSLFKYFLQRSECFKNHVIIFLDDDIKKYENSVNNVNIFALDKNKIESSTPHILQAATLSNPVTKKVDCAKLNNDLINYLLKIGFNPKFKGFDYIKRLITISAAQNNFTLSCLQKSVFPKLAIIFNKPVVNIERNIRSAIKQASKTENFIAEFSRLNLSYENITTRTFLSFMLNKCHNSYINNQPITDYKVGLQV